MMKFSHIALVALAMLAGAHKISSIEVKGGWVNLYDESGKKYKSLNANTTGDVLSVTGDTFTSRNGSWIITWDKDGKKVSSRAAR
jgi:hypothetical protein